VRNPRADPRARIAAARFARLSRVRRRLFNLAAAASLVLCVAVAALWLRSASVADAVGYDSNFHAASIQKDLALQSACGTITLRVILIPSEALARDDEDPPASFYRESSETGPDDDPLIAARRAGWTLFGFGYYPYQEPDSIGRAWTETFTKFELYLPHWFVALACAVLPARWLALAHRRRRGPAMACATCGYDLRATPERCPECGTVAGRGEAAATLSADGSGSSA
jgi:hypothetical protein